MKSNSCNSVAMSQLFHDLNDQIVRPDNSSVHVQGSYRPCESSKLLTNVIADRQPGYRPACYG